MISGDGRQLYPSHAYRMRTDAARTGRLAIPDALSGHARHQAPHHRSTPDHLPYGPAHRPGGQAPEPCSRPRPGLAASTEADSAGVGTCGARAGGAGAGHVHEEVSSRHRVTCLARVGGAESDRLVRRRQRSDHEGTEAWMGSPAGHRPCYGLPPPVA